MDGRDRERAGLEREVQRAAGLTDADRTRILQDLWRTYEAVCRTKTPEQLVREREVRRILEDDPARANYRSLVSRLG
jgi:hypothetical protein